MATGSRETDCQRFCLVGWRGGLGSHLRQITPECCVNTDEIGNQRLQSLRVDIEGIGVREEMPESQIVPNAKRRLARKYAGR